MHSYCVANVAVVPSSMVSDPFPSIVTSLATESIFLILKILFLTEATKGIQYIPEELRGPILKANKLYMDVAEEAK